MTARALSRNQLVGQMPLFTLIVLCIATALLTDRFLSPLNLTNIFVQSSIMSVIAIGVTFVMIGGGREAAYLSGVAVDRVVASTYVWCGGLAGLAGIMLAARLESGQPTAGEFYELTATAAVVLGGASLHGGEGTLYKSVIGVFIMIVLGNALNLLNVDSYWQRVAVGAVIIAAAAAERLRSRGSR